MKTKLLFLFFAMPFIGFAQNPDSLKIVLQIDSLINLEIKYAKERKWEESLEALEQAKQLTFEAFGNTHPFYTKSLANQGRTYKLMQKYEESEQCFIQAKELQEKYLGKENASYANTLNNFSNLYVAMRRYEKAEPLLLECLEIRERVLGKDHHNYANTLINLSRLYHSMGDYDKAEIWYVESKNILIKVLGEDHPNYASFLNNLAVFYKTIGRLKEAEENYLECLKIREQVLGKEHPDYFAILRNIGFFYTMIKEYDKAESLLIEGREVAIRNVDKDSLDYAQIINDLGILYAETGQYKKAETYYLESKEIRKRHLGTDHSDYVTCLGNLAILYTYQFKHEKAELFYLESIEKTKKIYGENHLYYASQLDNLANLYYYLGDYQKAEPLYLKTKSIIENSLGKNNLRYASTIHNLANLYKDFGQYKKAEKLHLESLSLEKDAFGEAHPKYAASLSSLANLYMAIHRYEKADSLYLIVKNIQEQHLSKEHPNYLATLNNMGLLYNNMEQYEKAESFFLKNLKLSEIIFEKNHPDAANTINNLAITYSKMGQFQKADSLYLKSKEIYQRSLGKDYPGYLSPVKGLATLNEKQQQYEYSEIYLTEVEDLQQSRLRKAISYLSEKELNDFSQLFQSNGNKMLDFAFDRNSNRIPLGHIPGLSYDNNLFYKGFLLNSVLQITKLANKSPEAAELFDELKSYRRRLAQQYTKTIQGRDTILIAELDEKANSIEKKLAREVTGYADALQQVDWKDVQNALKKGEAAIEFVHFKMDFPEETDSIMYAALLLLPDSRQPQFIPLFEEKEVQKFFESDTSGDSPLENISSIYDEDRMGNDNLYDLIWKPLQPFLEGINRVFYSPSGLLHKVSFAALPVSQDSFLMDKFDLELLTSTRELVFKDKSKNLSFSSVSLFGDVDFKSKNSVEDTMLIADIAENRSVLKCKLLSTKNTIPALPGSKKEIQFLQDLFYQNNIDTIEVNKKMNASESAFKMLGQGKHSPSILHISTHGFFFELSDVNSLYCADSVNTSWEVIITSQNPLLRSGLLLSGVEETIHLKESSKKQNDGILTALEIANVDLSNTHLAVLSACETALGDIAENEGVYGLQRAFKMAGVDKILMTLWKVDDEITNLFMQSFYTHLLQGATPEKALRLAQYEIRKEKPRSFYWAGFILL